MLDRFLNEPKLQYCKIKFSSSSSRSLLFFSFLVLLFSFFRSLFFAFSNSLTDKYVYVEMASVHLLKLDAEADGGDMKVCLFVCLFVCLLLFVFEMKNK